MQVVIDALKLYGATISLYGFISKGGKETAVKPVIKGKRLRFEGTQGFLVASGGITEKFVCEFVERFWKWEKVK